MGRLLPLRRDPESSPDGPRVLSLDDDASAEALSALSSDTARELLQAIYEQPRTAPELQEVVGTSLQNVHYHLERLEAADLIEAAATGYSEKGTEMNVYAPKSEALVLFAGEERDRSRVRETLSRLLGGVGVLALAALALRALLDRLGPTATTEGGTDGTGSVDDGAAGATTTSSPTGTDTPEGMSVEALGEETATPAADTTAGSTPTPEQVTETTVDVAAGGGAGDPGLVLDPAVAFFLGGLFMLVVVAAWLYWRPV